MLSAHGVWRTCRKLQIRDYRL